MQAQEETFLKLIRSLNDVDRLMILAIAKVQWWDKTVNRPATIKPEDKTKPKKEK